MTDDKYIESEFASIRREIQMVDDACQAAFGDVRRELGNRDVDWHRTITSLQRAVDKAEEEMKQKLSIMNEFRNALSDQAANFVQRAQFEDLRDRVEKTATRSELEATLVGRATRFAAAEQRLSELEVWRSNMQGRMWGIPVLVTVVAFIISQALRLLDRPGGLTP